MAMHEYEDRTFRNSQMCIVTGPNIEMAIKVNKRMKDIFEPKLGLYFSNKETVLELNGCSIEAYPSNHIDSFRSLDNPKFILLDEADFFRKGEQEEVRHVSERYIGKSDPYIVMVSTPNNPGGSILSDRTGTRRYLPIQKVEDGLHFWSWKNLHQGGNRQGQTIARVW